MVSTIAEKKRATPAQIALAWLLHKAQDIVPIPGTKRRKYLDDNIGAASVSLTDADIGALDSDLAPDRVSGVRYGERQMAQLDR